MWCVAIAAGFLGAYARYLSSYVPIWSLVIPGLILFAGACLSFWRFRLLAAVGFTGLSVLANGLYAVAGLYPDYMIIPALWIGWVLVLLPALAGLGWAWARLATGVEAIPRRSSKKSWALVAVLAMMPAITLATVWPLRLAFLVFKSSLESVADRVENGQNISSPQWVGPFRLAESGVDPEFKITGLFIDANPGGRTGFVRLHDADPEADRFRLLLGTDTNVSLGWGWSYRQDD